MPVQSIPASAIVNVTPGVIGAGGTALDTIGLILSSATRVPLGTVQSFPSQAAVSSYFGPAAAETALAGVYFAGSDNSPVKPAALLFAQYPTGAVAGFLRGGAGLTLAAVQAIVAGTLTIVADGVSKTSSALNLSAATSLSNAATLILAAFTSPGFGITFDSIANAFVVTSSTTGAASTVAFATGANAAPLLLTAATGAVTSAGAIAAVPATFMAALVTATEDFVSFGTAFEPSTSDKVAFAQWNNGQNNRFAYVMWDTSAAPKVVPDTTSAGALIIAAGYSGTIPIYALTNGANAMAFILGAMASIDFTRVNGRTTLAFRAQAGLVSDVTDALTAANLLANGYNFYGAYGTANQLFTFFYNGSITGSFKWADTYLNQIWLNNALQLSILSLLATLPSVPYNPAGNALIAAAAQDPIDAAVNTGVIQPGVALSASQIAAINAAAGLDVASTVQSRGWYFQVGTASAAVRAARGSPPITLWYTDGESVQKINLFSEVVL